MTHKIKKIFWVMTTIIISLCIYSLLRDYPKRNISYKMINNPNKQMSCAEFFRLIQNEEPINIQIFYIPFSSDATASLSEVHLFSDLSLKITIEHIAPICHKYFSGISSEMKLFEETTVQYRDFRYCCLIKSKSNKYIRFSISRISQDILFVNGQPYKVPFEIIDAFLKLLPARDYELAIDYFNKNGRINKEED